MKRTCSALTTSMMTPPFNILAKPALTAKLFSPSWAVCPFVVGNSVAIAFCGLDVELLCLVSDSEITLGSGIRLN